MRRHLSIALLTVPYACGTSSPPPDVVTTDAFRPESGSSDSGLDAMDAARGDDGTADVSMADESDSHGDSMAVSDVLDATTASDAVVIRVHYPFGSHAITIRGSGGGLSWTSGASMTSAGPDTVSYTISHLAAPIEWKPLLDDATWSRGSNYHATPGSTLDVYPHFMTTAGRVVTLIASFPSTHVATRPIYAYLPPSYDENTDATYPVVYMHDGQNLWAALPSIAFGATWNVDTAFDQAAESGACSNSTAVGWGGQPLGGSPKLCTGDGDCPSGSCVTFPEAIVIGVGNTSARINEYTPTTDPGTPGGGGADAYLAMLTTELKPQIDSMLRTRTGSASTAMAGSSLGGLVTAYAGLRQPEVWGALAELSPSTWWNGDVIVADVATTSPAPARPRIVYIDSGAGTADDQSDTDMLAAEYLSLGYIAGSNFRHVVQAGASHNEVYWAQRFPGAMQLVLGVR